MRSDATLDSAGLKNLLRKSGNARCQAGGSGTSQGEGDPTTLLSAGLRELAISAGGSATAACLSCCARGVNNEPQQDPAV